MSRYRLTSRGASRRRFVQGVMGSGLGWLCGANRALSGVAAASSVLSGTDISLDIGALPVNFTGQPRLATVINGQLPAPLLRFREGDVVTVRLSNSLTVPGSIHWHGLIVPADMDGVPGLSFTGISPGETFVYRFRLNQSGTYWYHSHSRFLEQTGLYGPIVIEPRAGERHRADRDYTVLLSDWSDLDPEHIYRTLKIKSNYYNYHERTVGDFIRDARDQGLKSALADRSMWGKMRMDPTDLADANGCAYTYLMNGSSPTDNWTGIFSRGERVRLRIINGSSMSIFDVRIPGLKLTVVAADGQDIEPVTVDEFRISAAEVFDVIVEPKEDRAYTVFAQSIDRTGYARGTLAPQAGMQAEIPPLDPRPLLLMSDMGMSHDMSSMDMAAMAGMDHGSMHHQSMPESGSDHAPAEHGPTVDMLNSAPRANLDDPGVGLRNNGRRVLTYADLHTLGGPIDRREATREVELHLTGHMQRYIWSFNGQKFSEAAPLKFNYGERLRIVLVNDSMMNHPIHLHGMWSEVQSEAGEFLVRKHTVNVQPGQKLSYCVTADALGHWAYHCHLLYHMEAGMFREVVVEHTDAQGASP
jgi:CopA family copper-resistance protein